MASPLESGCALSSSSLELFFRHSVSRAIRRRGVDTRELTLDYLVDLLTHFSRSENLFDYTDEGIRLRPLAQLYAQAVQSESLSERRLMMRRMGDVALFVSGMFSGFFQRRRAVVGKDYYIAMGGQAYACLSSDCGRSGGDPGLNAVYAQLSGGFAGYVGVLAEVRECGVRERIDDWSALLEAATPSDDGRFDESAIGVGNGDCAGAVYSGWRH